MTLTQEIQEYSGTLECAWYFWNHCFYNRVRPSRVIKTKTGRKCDVICHDCGKLILAVEMRRKIKPYAKDPKKPDISISPGNPIYVCRHCDDIRKHELAKQKVAEDSRFRGEKTREFLDSVAQFDDVMADCKFGTCDIFSAHHELFKDDPNRLRTDFLIELVCGEEKKKEYLKITQEGR